MPYLELTPSIDCVDDAQSSRYKRLRTARRDAGLEQRGTHARGGEAYRWGVVVDQNPAPSKKRRLVRIPARVERCGHGTAGCTAMPRERIEAVLGC